MIHIFNNVDDDFIMVLRQKYDIILVDIDGVLLTPEQYLCSSLWYTEFIKSTATINYGIHHLCNQYEFCSSNIKSWLPKNEYATNLADDLYHCMASTDFIPVNQLLINILAELSQTKLVLGLTGRAHNFHSNTAHWLEAHGMQFTNYTIAIDSHQTSRLEAGIIYVGHDSSTALPHDKGEILGLFLNKMNLIPKRVLFIDDFVKNLANVENYCLLNGIEFTGIHYKEYENDLRDTFTKDEIRMIGSAQYHHFFRTSGVILSDQAALDYCRAVENSCDNYSYSNSSWFEWWNL